MARGSTPPPEIVLTGLWGWLSRKLDIQPWGQVLIVLLGLAVVAIGGEFLHIELRLAKIETQIENIPLQISSALVSQAAKHAKIGQYEQAAQALQSASALVQQATENNIGSKADYFAKQVRVLSDIGTQNVPLNDEISQFKVTLATYRSRLNPQPELPKETSDLHSPPAGQLERRIYRLPAGLEIHIGSPTTFTSLVHSAFKADSRDHDMLIPDTNQWEKNKIKVDGVDMVDGSQALDGIEWENMTFINMRIRYTGGTTRLRNVRFVNCTFDLPPDSNGNRLADYASLEQAGEFNLG